MKKTDVHVRVFNSEEEAYAIGYDNVLAYRAQFIAYTAQADAEAIQRVIEQKHPAKTAFNPLEVKAEKLLDVAAEGWQPKE